MCSICSNSTRVHIGRVVPDFPRAIIDVCPCEVVLKKQAGEGRPQDAVRSVPCTAAQTGPRSRWWWWWPSLGTGTVDTHLHHHHCTSMLSVFAPYDSKSSNTYSYNREVEGAREGGTERERELIVGIDTKVSAAIAGLVGTCTPLRAVDEAAGWLEHTHVPVPAAKAAMVVIATCISDTGGTRLINARPTGIQRSETTCRA